MAPQYTILVVDDDPTIGEVLNRAAIQTFKEAYFIIFGQTQDALTYLKDIRGIGPRLVLLSSQLEVQAGLTSLEFIDLLRHHPKWRLIPVVVLSTIDDEILFEQAYSKGVNAITSKPVHDTAWEDYLHQLRTYWFSVVTLPKLWFSGR